MGNIRKTGLHPFDHAALDSKIIQAPLDLTDPSSGKGYVMANTESERMLCDSICHIIQSTCVPVGHDTT